MGVEYVTVFFFFLLHMSFPYSGTCIEGSENHRPSFHPKFHTQTSKLERTTQNLQNSFNEISQRDVMFPTTTTPTYQNPITDSYITPRSPTPKSSIGQSWCVASPSASETALQIGLDYACGYGGADCVNIQQSGNCYYPNTVRDHASYAFNSYYQNNPIPTSCSFGGTAITTSTDPSTSTCLYPSSSISSSTLDTTIPTGVFGLGSSPPNYSNTNSNLISKSYSLTIISLSISLVCLKVYN